MRFKLLYSWHEPQCQNQKRDQSITFLHANFPDIVLDLFV